MRLPSTPRSPARLVALALLLLAGSPAVYADDALTLKLTGAAEVPRDNSSATGVARITVGADHAVAGSVTVSGMKPTAAHIHMGAPGKAGPIVIPMNKTGADTFTVPPGARLTDAQYAGYLKGDLYVNVHSAAHPAGEIRAQLTPTTQTSRAPATGY